MICSFARSLALAAGCLGLFGLSVFPTAAQTSLISTGSLWRYFDLGTEPADWRNPLFNDADWASGAAQLGFGEGDEATVLARNNSAGATNIAFYFRHTFNVPDPSTFSNLLVRVRRDDGAIVYLNGEEVFRSNMPPGPVNQDTFALMAASDDGAGFYASPVMISLLVPGANVLAVEVHQSSLTSSDVSFDLELSANVLFQAPKVILVKPADGDVIGSAQVNLMATASDTDGVIAAVEFLEGANTIGTATPTNASHALTWSNVPPGSYTLRAVAVDSTGLSATSAPVSILVVPSLVPRNAAWSYLDDGSDPGGAWASAGFDDSAWSNGVAQLGYGDGDEATLINGGPAASRFITTYFRHPFTVADPGVHSSLVLRVLRDDGVVAYLNGTEIFRHNMPGGPVDHLTPASSAIDDEKFHATPVNPALLAAGPNLLAVEIHQSGPSSSDVSFDLELLPDVAPTPPVITLASPTNNATFLGPLTINAAVTTWDLDNAVVSVTLYSGDTLLDSSGVNVEGDATLAGLLNPGAHTLRAVATDATGLSSTSAPVNVTVIPAPILTTLVSTGSIWRYFDANVNLGTAWRQPVYDDASWSNGAGILGFGALGQASALPATLINGGPSGSRTITAYFRHRFTATNGAAVTNLAFRVVRDDGVVAYLNGTEVFRMNMPTGAVVSSTRANVNVAGTNELFYAPTNVAASPGLLLEGDNVLAVELHQDMPTTSDGAFDLSLVAVSSPSPPPPTPSIAYLPPDIVLTWPGTGFILQRASVPEGPYTDVVPASSPYTVPDPGGSGFFRIKQEP